MAPRTRGQRVIAAANNVVAPTTQPAQVGMNNEDQEVLYLGIGATGEEMIYQKSYDMDGEVAWTQMKMAGEGLVPYTSEEEEEDEGTEDVEMQDWDVDEDEDMEDEEEDDDDWVPEGRRAVAKPRKDNTASNKTLEKNDPPGKTTTRRNTRRRINNHGRILEADGHDKGDYGESVYPEFQVDQTLHHAPISEEELHRCSRNSEDMGSRLKNFLLSDLSAINGYNSHAMEAAEYDRTRSRAAIFHYPNGRPAYIDRDPMFRPSNRLFKQYADEGPSHP